MRSDCTALTGDLLSTCELSGLSRGCGCSCGSILSFSRTGCAAAEMDTLCNSAMLRLLTPPSYQLCYELPVEPAMFARLGFRRAACRREVLTGLAERLEGGDFREVFAPIFLSSAPLPASLRVFTPHRARKSAVRVRSVGSWPATRAVR